MHTKGFEGTVSDYPGPRWKHVVRYLGPSTTRNERDRLGVMALPLTY